MSSFSVCVYVCISHVSYLHQNEKKYLQQFSASARQVILAFTRQIGWRYSHVNPHNAAIKCRCGTAET